MDQSLAQIFYTLGIIVCALVIISFIAVSIVVLALMRQIAEIKMYLKNRAYAKVLGAIVSKTPQAAALFLASNVISFVMNRKRRK